MEELELNGLEVLTDSRFYYRQCMLQLMVEYWNWELFCYEHVTLDMSFTEYLVCGADVEDQLFNYQYEWSPMWTAPSPESEEEVEEETVFEVFEPCAGAA